MTNRFRAVKFKPDHIQASLGCVPGWDVRDSQGNLWASWIETEAEAQEWAADLNTTKSEDESRALNKRRFAAKYEREQLLSQTP